MTAIVRLTRAEFRKLATTRSYPITLIVAVGLALLEVAAVAMAAGRNGVPRLGSAAGTNQMLKLGAICSVAMLVVGIMAAGGEFRHKTIIPAVLISPRRNGLVLAKAIAVGAAGVVLSSLTFGLGLATAVAVLAFRHFHHLPADTWRLYAGSVISGTLFGLIGVALGFITRSTVAAALGAVGWVLFGEIVILGTMAPHLARWLITGASMALTDPAVPGASTLAPTTATAVLSAYALALLAAAVGVLARRDIG